MFDFFWLVIGKLDFEIEVKSRSKRCKKNHVPKIIFFSNFFLKKMFVIKASTHSTSKSSSKLLLTPNRFFWGDNQLDNVQLDNVQRARLSFIYILSISFTFMGIWIFFNFQYFLHKSYLKNKQPNSFFLNFFLRRLDTIIHHGNQTWAKRAGTPCS